jgi:exosortase
MLASVGFAVVAWRALPEVGAPAHGSSLTGAEAMLFEPTGNSPPLVFAATLWLLWRRWPRLRAALGCPPQRIPAALLFALGAALCLWSHYVGAPSLLLPALTAVLLAAGFWLGGAPGARALLLPAFFVLVAFPIPAALINQFMYPLQLFTAKTVGALLDAVGLPTRVQGDLIFRDGATFQVIESCSGVRTIETIVMSAFLYHDLFFRSRLQSWILFALAPFVGLVSNLLRVIGIVLNPYSKFAAIHTMQGLVMIVVAVLLLAAVDLALTRILPARAPGQRMRLRSPLPLGTARAASLAAALGALAVATLVLQPWQEPPIQEKPVSAFPIEIDGFRGDGLRLDKEFYGSTTFSEWTHRRYVRDGVWVEVLIGTDRRLDPFVSPVSLKAAVPGPGSMIEARDRLVLPDGTVGERLIVHSKRGRDVVYRWSEGVRSPGREVGRALLSLDRGPQRRTGRAFVVRLTTQADSRADERLQQFAVRTREALAREFGAEIQAP